MAPIIVGNTILWDWEYAAQIFPTLLAALKITIGATLLGFALACILGLPLAFGRRSACRPLTLLTGGLVEFVRSTPLLAQLFFIYWGLAEFLGVTMSAFTAGVTGLGIHYAAYLSEVYRAGIDAVPRGQWEAATALGFSPLRTWTNIILPQAIPPVLPVMGNYLIGMFKDTPMLSAITVVELLQTAKIIGTRSFRFVEPFTIVGLLFLLLSYLSSLGVARLEARFKRGSA